MKKFLYRIFRIVIAIIFFPITIFRFLSTAFLFMIKLFGGSSTGVTGLSRFFLFLIVVTFSGFVYWASTSEMETVISGTGKLVPLKKLQTVEHYGGGILSNINVEVGDKVRKGQILLKLDPLENEANYESLRSEFVETLITIQRLNSEYTNIEPKFTEEMKQLAPSQIRNQMLLKQARQLSFNANMASFDAQLRQSQSQLKGQERTLALIEEERVAILQLVAKGLEPKLEAVRAEKTYAEAIAGVESLRASMDQIREQKSIAVQEQKANILAELADTNLKLSQMEKQLSVSADKTDRTVIRSPIDGIVNRVLMTTLNSVVGGGEPLVEIVPEDNELLFEAQIMPQDIAYIIKGQKALLKLSAYDFAQFGFLEGEVTIVGSDSVEEDGAPAYYPVKIKPLSSESSIGRKLALVPGMEAAIDIVVGKRSIISYITYPVSRTLDTAFTEN
ncbi:HlyD family type I secretion periplasmic adaptor subunit [Alphaproteobacteria bacterium]|nr:HlyD family type I secretion periplasmic adaptor subunit [Alphaproteobacteria bacterium]